MSTAKVINVQHPSSATTNLVNDASGNVTVGNNLTVTGAASITGNVSGTWNGTAISAAKGGTGLTAPGTSGNVLTSNGTTWASSAPASSGITSGTAVASTSGTSIDFTGIPATAKQITIMFNGVSTNGSNNLLVQLGTIGGVQSSGYTSGAWTSNTSNANSTSGFLVSAQTTAAFVLDGLVTICLLNLSTGLWVYSSAGAIYNNGSQVGGGNKTLSGTLDRVRITTVGGTDTFDAGSINILYQ